LEATILRIQSAGSIVRLEIRTSEGQVLTAEISQERFATMDVKVGSNIFVRPRHIRVFANGQV